MTTKQKTLTGAAAVAAATSVLLLVPDAPAPPSPPKTVINYSSSCYPCWSQEVTNLTSTNWSKTVYRTNDWTVTNDFGAERYTRALVSTNPTITTTTTLQSNQWFAYIVNGKTNLTKSATNRPVFKVGSTNDVRVCLCNSNYYRNNVTNANATWLCSEPQQMTFKVPVKLEIAIR